MTDSNPINNVQRSSSQESTHASCSHQLNTYDTVEAKEVALRSVELGCKSPNEPLPPTSFQVSPTVTYINELPPNNVIPSIRLCLTPINTGGASTSTNPQPISITLKSLFGNSELISPMSFNMIRPNEPQSLFIQALAKLTGSPLSLALTKRIHTNTPQSGMQSDQIQDLTGKSPQVSLEAPDSLTSAPPSYSFVLRQMNARRRPRLMGTFIPSPSFVQHTPPPNYAAAFDIYVDNPMPPPQPRQVNFGFMSMPAICPECGYTGLTVVRSKITICTHLCAFILCLFCCWICAPLPYLLRSCKDVYHYCRNCRNLLGMYCPTNPENTYP